MDLLLATFIVTVVGSSAAIATWLFGDRIFYRVLARIPRKPTILRISLGSVMHSGGKLSFTVLVHVANSTSDFVEVQGLQLVARADRGLVHRLNLNAKDAEGRLGALEQKYAYATLGDVDAFCGGAEWITLTTRGKVENKKQVYSLRVNRAITAEIRTRKHIPEAGDAQLWDARRT